MKSILFLLVVLGLGCAGGYYLHQGPGQAVFSYQDWVVQMPLWLAAILTFFLAFLIFFLFKLTTFIAQSKSLFKQWQQKRLEDKARSLMNQGLIELTEGHWAKAEKLLTHTVIKDTSLISYLFAAKAAQAQGAYERRDDYLRMAHKSNPKADIAVSLTQAQLQLDHNQFEQALATLMHIKSISPKHKTALALLKDLYIKLNDWQNLLKLIPNLLKQKVIDKELAHSLESMSYREILESTEATDDSLEAINELWRHAPEHIVRNNSLSELYIKLLIASNAHKEAEIRIRESLKYQWQPNLVHMYGQLKLPENSKQLTTAERWLESHPNDPYLLLTLGYICIHQRLWGKAKDYLNASLSLAPMRETYHTLAKLLEETGSVEEANEFYRQGFLSEAKPTLATS